MFMNYIFLSRPLTSVGTGSYYIYIYIAELKDYNLILNNVLLLLLSVITLYSYVYMSVQSYF